MSCELLPQWMIDKMREIQDENLVDTCTIKHYVSKANNGRGGWTITYSTEDNVPCRLWISSGPNGTSEEARFYGEHETNITNAFLILSWDQDINEKDVVVYDNRQWAVTGYQSNDTFITAKRVRLVAPRPESL